MMKRDPFRLLQEEAMPRVIIPAAFALLLTMPALAQDAQTAAPANPAPEATTKAQAPTTPPSPAPAVVTPVRKTGCSHEKPVNS